MARPTNQRTADTAVERFVPSPPVDQRVEDIQAGQFVPVPDDSTQPNRKAAAKKARGPPIERLGYSIPEFCAAHGFSVAQYYASLKKNGLAPREMRVGNRKIISVEEAARWRAERTAESDSSAA